MSDSILQLCLSDTSIRTFNGVFVLFVGGIIILALILTDPKRASSGDKVNMRIFRLSLFFLLIMNLAVGSLLAEVIYELSCKILLEQAWMNFADVRSGNISAYEDGKVNYTVLEQWQDQLPDSYSAGGAIAIEYGLGSINARSAELGFGVEGTQGVFVSEGGNTTHFTASALFGDVSRISSRVEVAFELFFVNSEFNDFQGLSTAVEVGLLAALM